MIDMGMHKGQHVFYTGGKSLAELIADGEILAIPDAEQGMILKRPIRCTELEKAAAFTLEEATAFVEQWNAKIKETQND